MSWNGSGPGGNPSPPSLHKRRHGARSVLYACIVVAALVLLAACLLVMRRIDHSTPENTKGLRPIAVVPSAKIRNNGAVSKRAKVIAGTSIEMPSAEHADIVLSARKGRVVKWVHHEKPLFANQFENYVASLITASPGERFFDVDLGDEMDESFEASLTNSIVVTAEDTEEMAAIKDATIQAKEEIRRRTADGTRPSEILAGIREEMNKIADIRDQLQDEFNAIVLKGTDPDEVLRFAKEANALLKEYDALPIDAPDDVEGAYDALESAKQAVIEEIDAESRNREESKKRKPEGE